MPFDTALSGIRAASTELTVTGNNIANASTTGFKSSRTEFADVYATSVLGSGSNAIGSGVQVSEVSQQFSQGNVAFTEKETDLAINGNGFFVLSDGGETRYSRAGAFGLNQDGFIANSTGALLQGFSADAQGNIGDIAGNVSITTSNLDPRRTTSVESVLNLDASQAVLQESGREIITSGVNVGLANSGLQSATSTTLSSAAFTLPMANDFSTTSIDFDVDLSAGTNIGTVSISLDSAAGVPGTVSTFNDLRILASVINAQIFSPSGGQSTIDVVADAVDLGGGTFGIEFSAIEEGVSSTISLANLTANSSQLGLSGPVPTSVAGIPQVTNGYSAQPIEITTPDGSTVTYNAQAGDTAAETASGLNSLQGITATAQTQAEISGYNSPNGNMIVTINNVQLSGDSLAALETEINTLSNTTLPGVSAVLDTTGTALNLVSAGGDDIEISITSIDDGDSLTMQGLVSTNGGLGVGRPQILEADPSADGVSVPPATADIFSAETNSVIVGGEITILLDDGYDIAQPTIQNIIQPLSPAEFTDVVINDFDPGDQATYNSATSMTIYDSLGTSHVMTQYFVKQDYDPNSPTSIPNHWQVHVQIDGFDVGDPDTTLAPPQNTVATRASYNIYFNDDGTLDETQSDNILVSNWEVRDGSGAINDGAAGPQTVLAGATIPVAEPPTSSNFVIDFNGTTQFGSAFSVNDVDQDGFATGRLSGLSIDDGGVIFARFTNGESQILGQVALADFPNQEGLQPSGNSTWVENFRSGEPRVAAANTGSLGAIQSGALEESNVDISAELVNLIIAQRNFQASAKTIETADSVTQTIINLR
ncbi:MAG: flagellar hook-basal body complex protein [Agarilytica sp.]